MIVLLSKSESYGWEKIVEGRYTSQLGGNLKPEGALDTSKRNILADNEAYERRGLFNLCYYSMQDKPA